MRWSAKKQRAVAMSLMVSARHAPPGQRSRYLSLARGLLALAEAQERDPSLRPRPARAMAKARNRSARSE
jgi:hypothetical protein